MIHDVEGINVSKAAVNDGMSLVDGVIVEGLSDAERPRSQLLDVQRKEHCGWTGGTVQGF